MTCSCRWVDDITAKSVDGCMPMPIFVVLLPDIEYIFGFGPFSSRSENSDSNSSIFAMSPMRQKSYRNSFSFFRGVPESARLMFCAIWNLHGLLQTSWIAFSSSVSPSGIVGSRLFQA